MLDMEKGGDIRWKIAIKSVDIFLTDFKLSVKEKLDLISRLSNSFFNEHGGDKDLKLVLDDKFRTLRPQLESILSEAEDEEKDYYPIIKMLKNRSELNQQTVNKLLLLKSNNNLQVSIKDLLASLLHMNIDRLFIGRNRTNELVIYDLLARYYKSNLARSIKISHKELQKNI